ncbi:hypothetical protein ES705_44154 [subsurface metagenome]
MIFYRIVDDPEQAPFTSDRSISASGGQKPASAVDLPHIDSGRRAADSRARKDFTILIRTNQLSRLSTEMVRQSRTVACQNDRVVGPFAQPECRKTDTGQLRLAHLRRGKDHDPAF